MIKLPILTKETISDKKVFLRLDLDVPLELRINNEELIIKDDTRLKAGLQTLNFLLENNATVIIAGHLGRPNGIDKSLSLEPVARWLVSELRVEKIEEFEGWQIGSNIFLLENLRFHEEEEQNNPEFAKSLSSLADVYVNDVFAMCHRNHASIVGVPSYLPHFAGFRLQKEIEVLNGLIDAPQRPLLVIIGGAKIETKLPLVEKMHKFADYVLVGGKIATEKDVLIKVQESPGSKLLIANLNEEKTDLKEESLQQFLSILPLAKTIVWNGPLGKTEDSTEKLAKEIIKTNVYSVVGGGDTTEYLNKIGLLDKFSFVSTGGGAMLTFLSGSKLPGLEALLQ